MISLPVALVLLSTRPLGPISPCQPLLVSAALSSTLPLALGRLLWLPRASFSRLSPFGLYFARHLPLALVCTPAFVLPSFSGRHPFPLLLVFQPLGFGLLAQL